MASGDFDSSADLFDDSDVVEVSQTESSSPSSSDEEVIVTNKKNVRRIIESDEDEEEDREEVKQLMSPRTRRSIGYTSYRSSRDEDKETDDNSDEESETDVEDEESDSEEKLLHSPSTRKSIGGNFQQATSSFNSTEELKTINYSDEHVPEVTDLTMDSDTSNRASFPLVGKAFEKSIAEKLSSTHIGHPHKPELSIVLSDDSVIEIVDEDTSKKKVQATLTRFVSRTFYYDEARKVDELKQKIKTIENLYRKSADDLPDKGASLKRNLNELKHRLEVESANLAQLQIDENQSLKRSLQNSVNDEIVVVEDYKPTEKPAPGINWDEIKKANALVEPKYTGQRGLATFGNQKERVEKGLHRIHGSLADQPSETDLEPTPEGVNIELMDHQKSALKWMIWRESFRPRGGILADDMGLGKTLSMLALILTKLDEKENEDADDESDSDEAESSWTNKRRDEKYHGGTLIVCPASLMGQWENEVKNRVRRGYVDFQLHHGAKREQKARRLARVNIVCTTYNIVSVEHENGGPLQKIKWNRVVLDEAHMIRNHKTKISFACSQLNARYRWALTGTPICNKEIDVYALLRYLRVQPFDDLPTYKRWLDDKNHGGAPRLHALIKTLMLRRTKQMLQEKEQLKLPEREWNLISIEFTSQESTVYQKVMAQSRALFTQYLAQQHTHSEPGKFDRMHARYAAHGGQTSTVQMHRILTLLLRLRQICCHPGLINTMIDSADVDVSTSEFNDVDLINRLAKIDLSASTDEPDEDIVRMSAVVLNRANPVFDLHNPSSKIRYTINHFKENILNSNDKAVFVSQWTSFLELFHAPLAALGVKFCEINGKVPVKDRGQIVENFNKVGRGPTVMLLALTAGGVGLNLVGANHLYLLDLHWNPQLENQAQDRIFRVGQKKKVNIYKFMMKSAIEEKIHELQKKKLELANAVLTGAKNMGSKLTIQDLRTLFEV